MGTPRSVVIRVLFGFNGACVHFVCREALTQFFTPMVPNKIRPLHAEATRFLIMFAVRVFQPSANSRIIFI